jgi:thioredoxin 1
MDSPNVLELTEANWTEHVTSGTLVVVDFWAPWCGPCRRLSTVMDQIADQFAGKIKVGKLNIDENPTIAVKYDVMTIPQILFFRGTEEPIHKETLLSTEALAELVTKLDVKGPEEQKAETEQPSPGTQEPGTSSQEPTSETHEPSPSLQAQETAQGVNG